MIKKIIILCFIFISLTSRVFSAGNCLISSWPASIIDDYIKNNEIVIKNITNQIKDPNTESKKSIKENITSLFNDFINWTWYGSYFKYYVVFPLSNDISKEVKRDYKLLDKQWESLNKYLKIIAKKWYNINIKTACDWISENCELDWKAIDIIWKLIKNQSKVIDIYRRIVMWEISWTWEDFGLILVDSDNFITQMVTHYWAWNNCTDSEDSFFGTIIEKIKNIWTLNEQGKKWMEEWKEAIALLNWSKPTNKLEEELLTKELSRQWISWEKAEAILWNLKKFNQNWGYSKDNNFITNSFNHLKDTIDYEVKKFKTNVIDEFKNSAKKLPTKSINSLLNEKDTVNINQFIAESVSQVYNNELPFIEIWDKNAITIRTDIINIHNNLNNWIIKLSKLIEVSEKVCDDQSTWEWKCTTK